MAKVFTKFDRSAMPTNLITVQDWNRFHHNCLDWCKQTLKAHCLRPSRTWAETAARAWALDNGGALIAKADDSLVVFTLRESGLERRIYRSGTWGWA